MAARHLVVVMVTVASAHADPAMIATAPPRALAWRAPAECPDAAGMRARIEQRLERSLDDVVIGVEVDVALAAGRFVARIDLRAVTVANDVRTLTSKRCNELADAVAVIVARVASEQIARRRGDAEEVVAAVSVVRTSAPPPPRRWALGARVSGVSGIGIIPKVGLGGEVAVTFRRDSTLVELAGTRWFMSAAQGYYDGAPSKVDVDLDTAAARVGWRPPHLPLRAWTALEVGSMRGNNIALPSQHLDAGMWIAAGAGFGVAWQMNRWSRLLGYTETMLAIERARFSLGEGNVVYAPSPMSFRASCGLEIGWQ